MSAGDRCPNMRRAAARPLNALLEHAVCLSKVRRMDPFESVVADISQHPMYFRWVADKMWLYQPMQVFVGGFLQTFQEFPQRQASSSFNIGEIMDKMQSGATTGR